MTELHAHMRGEIRTADLLIKHILAGHSILTIRSRKTNHRFTYRFRKPEKLTPGGEPIWVSLYGGDRSESQGYTIDTRPRDQRWSVWSFLGTFWPGRPEGGRYVLKPSPKSRIDLRDPAMLTAAWMVNHAVHPQVILDQADVWHEGRCGRCGRRLTVPKSIDTGFGPDCREAVGL